jgi:hypothetical protein
MSANGSIEIQRIKDSWKSKLFCCPKGTCGSGLSNFGTAVSFSELDVDGLVECVCPKCNQKWFLCRKCNNTGRTIHPIMSMVAVYNHNYRIHKERNEPRKKKRIEVECSSKVYYEDSLHLSKKLDESSTRLIPDDYTDDNYELSIFEEMEDPDMQDDSVSDAEDNLQSGAEVVDCS